MDDPSFIFTGIVNAFEFLVLSSFATAVANLCNFCLEAILIQFQPRLSTTTNSFAHIYGGNKTFTCRIVLMIFHVTITFTILNCVIWHGSFASVSDIPGVECVMVYVGLRFLLHLRSLTSTSRCSTASAAEVFAWQYYYGYLDIILPDLSERMVALEKQEGVKFAVGRLLLLVPESCFIEPTLNQHFADDKGFAIITCSKMTPVIRNRCGTKNRLYKNQVYTILDKDTKHSVTVVVEGISILSYFYTMSHSESPLTRMTDKMRRSQLNVFCSTLNEILKKSSYSHLVEVVQFKDRDDRDLPVKLSSIVIKVIGQQSRDAPDFYLREITTTKSNKIT